MVTQAKDETDWSRADAKTDAEIAADTAADPAWAGISEKWFENTSVVSGAPFQSAAAQREVSLRLDADVLAFFESTGSDWRTRVNDVLRRFMSERA